MGPARHQASGSERHLPAAQLRRDPRDGHPGAAANLDPDVYYGIQWFNRDKVTMRTISEPDGSGGRRYRKMRTSQRRPREEWVAIPVPTSPLLTRDLVDLARAVMDASTGSERKHLAREWELRGVMRCSCGATMQTKSTNPQ